MRGLIVGLGSIGLKHVDAIKSIDDQIELIALRSKLDAPIVPNIRNLFSIEDVNKGDFDFVIISNPSAMHFDTISQIIHLNIPIFLEKPAITQSDEIEKLSKLINNYKATTYMGCNLRFLESLIFAKEHLIDKTIHEVNIYAGSYLPDWRPDTDYKISYSALPQLGGGVHFDLIHELDYVYWLWGKPTSTTCLRRSKSTINIDAIDYANYNLIYPDFVVNIILNYYRRDYKRTAEIVLENETVELNLKTNNFYNSEEHLYFDSDQTILDTYKDQMRYFLNLVQTGEESFNTILDGLEVLKICLSE